MNSLTATRRLCQLSTQRAAVLRTSNNYPRQQFLHRCLHNQSSPPSLLRNSTSRGRFQQCKHVAQQKRYESAARPLTDRPEHAPEPDSPREEQPSYEMTFTCRVCAERSSHRITKQGYHHGTILITCPGCKNRHLISDHMKVYLLPLTAIWRAKC